MTTITIEVPIKYKVEYEEIFTNLVKRYDINKLRNLYKIDEKNDSGIEIFNIDEEEELMSAPQYKTLKSTLNKAFLGK